MPSGPGVESWVQWALGLVAMAVMGIVGGMIRAWQHVNGRLSQHVADLHKKHDALRDDVSHMKQEAGRYETTVQDHERRIAESETKAAAITRLEATIEAMQRTLDRIDGKLR